MLSLRPDRGSTLAWLASRMHLTQKSARGVLRALVKEGFVKQTRSGSYVRRAPTAPILDRIIAVESKRSDWRTALVQARSHQAFADAVYVAFDSAFSARFTRALPQFQKTGVGLISLAATSPHYECLAHSQRGRARHRLAASLASESALARLLGSTSRTLPESRLPSASGATDCQGPPQLLGPHSKTVELLLDDLLGSQGAKRRRR